MCNGQRVQSIHVRCREENDRKCNGIMLGSREMLYRLSRKEAGADGCRLRRGARLQCRRGSGLLTFPYYPA